jgi:hypothetical protein
MVEASILKVFPVALYRELKMRKYFVLVTFLAALCNVTGGEKPAMNILSGNNITVVMSK